MLSGLHTQRQGHLPGGTKRNRFNWQQLKQFTTDLLLYFVQNQTGKDLISAITFIRKQMNFGYIWFHSAF